MNKIFTLFCLLFIPAIALGQNHGSGVVTAFADRITNAETAGAHSIDINHTRELAVVVGKAGTVSIIDISDPTNMVQRSGTSALTDAEAVKWLDDTYCWIGATTWGVLDVTTPTSFVWSQGPSAHTNSGSLNQCQLYTSGATTYLYAANKGPNNVNGTIEIFDVTDPSSVSRLTAYIEPNGINIHGLDVNEDGYLVAVHKGDTAYDVSLYSLADPEDPELLDTVARTNTNECNQVCFHPNAPSHFYVCGSPELSSSDNGVVTHFQIVNDELVFVEEIDSGYEGHGLWITNDNILYIGTSNIDLIGTTLSELVVVDVNSLTQATVLQNYSHANFVDIHQIQIHKNHAILTCGGISNLYLKNVSSVQLSGYGGLAVDGVAFGEVQAWSPNRISASVADGFGLADVTTERSSIGITASDVIALSESVFPNRGNMIMDHVILNRVIITD